MMQSNIQSLLNYICSTNEFLFLVCNFFLNVVFVFILLLLLFFWCLESSSLIWVWKRAKPKFAWRQSPRPGPSSGYESLNAFRPIHLCVAELPSKKFMQLNENLCIQRIKLASIKKSDSSNYPKIYIYI